MAPRSLRAESHTVRHATGRTATHEGDGYSPELALITECIRPQIDNGRVRRIARHSVDTTRFVLLARHHRVIPLVRHTLERCGKDGDIPDNALWERCLETLRDEARAESVRSLQNVAELTRIVRAFGEEGVPVLSLKGPALAQQLYGNTALRSSADLDLLIAEQDVPTADRLLRSLEYEGQQPLVNHCLEHSGSFGSAAVRLAARFEYHNTYFRPGRYSLIELHWRLMENDRYHFAEDAFASKATALVANVKVPVPQPKDHFLYLCVHGAKHAWCQLKWLADIGQFATHFNDAQLAEIHQQADTIGAGRSVKQAFTLSDQLLGTNLQKRAGIEGTSPVMRRLCAYTQTRIDTMDSTGYIPTGPWLSTRLRELNYAMALWPDLSGKRNVIVVALYLKARNIEVLRLPDRLTRAYIALKPLT